MRETIPEANRLIGAISSHDISVPPSRLAEFIAPRRPGDRRRSIPALRINCFGHLGDGNLHYNVFPPQGRARERLRAAARAGEAARCTTSCTRSAGRSAAEHGVGRLKVGDLERYGDPGEGSRRCATIKAALGSRMGILNPRRLAAVRLLGGEEDCAPSLGGGEGEKGRLSRLEGLRFASSRPFGHPLFGGEWLPKV